MNKAYLEWTLWQRHCPKKYKLGHVKDEVITILAKIVEEQSTEIGPKDSILAITSLLAILSV